MAKAITVFDFQKKIKINNVYELRVFSWLYFYPKNLLFSLDLINIQISYLDGSVDFYFGLLYFAFGFNLIRTDSTATEP